MEERGEVAAAPGSSSAGLGVGPEAVAAGAGLSGIQEESGMRREGSGSGSGPETDPDAPPKKRVRLQEGEAGKLEERLYSVLCCTVCLDLPKASVYQVITDTVTPLLLHLHIHSIAVQASRDAMRNFGPCNRLLHWALCQGQFSFPWTAFL